jgi:7,8-dihydropterin-6-yl-methyl-4-(beta-D-ribofuranosyl)aminobenzene 5'-phosphate synthase
MRRRNVKLHVLYDNRALPGYTADWGFACLVEADETVLFDTGAKPDLLARNMEAAGVGPAGIGHVVLSHDHDDHTGGLECVTRDRTGLRVYVLPGFGEAARRRAGPGAEIVEVTAPMQIVGGVATTGAVQDTVSEQALVLTTPSGRVVLTGCAHPGVDRILEAAGGAAGTHAVLGGFHGFDRLDALEGIPSLGACHCTQKMSEIAARFPEAWCEIRAGVCLEF